MYTALNVYRADTPQRLDYESRPKDMESCVDEIPKVRAWQLGEPTSDKVSDILVDTKRPPRGYEPGAKPPKFIGTFRGLPILPIDHTCLIYPASTTPLYGSSCLCVFVDSEFILYCRRSTSPRPALPESIYPASARKNIFGGQC